VSDGNDLSNNGNGGWNGDSVQVRGAARIGLANKLIY
jgi:hypothetical protein